MSDHNSLPRNRLERRTFDAATGGFTVIELLTVLSIASVAFSMVWPSLSGAYSRRVTAAVTEQLVQLHDRTRSAAVQYGRVAELHLDESNSRVWVQVDTTGTGAGVDTIGLVRDFSGDRVRISTDANVLCFGPRGLPVTPGGCQGPTATITVSHSDASETLSVQSNGTIVR